MKKTNDLSAFANILPYSSEIFGVYQPLLGWKSKRILDRIKKGYLNDMKGIFSTVKQSLNPSFEIKVNTDRFPERISFINPATPLIDKKNSNSFLVDEIARNLPPEAEYNPAIWDQLLNGDKIKDILNTVVIDKVMEGYKSMPNQPGLARSSKSMNQFLAEQVNTESVAAGYLLQLKEAKSYDKLKDLFYLKNENFKKMLQLLQFDNPFDTIDPFHDLDRVGLSPIGIVHLFRQYFFEFDSFLGTPVNHVWLSPGSTVELVEITTRRTLTEKTYEHTTESTIKTERAVTEQDEISEAVKEDNRNDTKFGVNATVNQGWIGGSATASSSINLDKTQQKAREESHKHMRQQTEKLSTEIRNNYKSTFKTITEVTDTSSKRYLLSNSTQKLINYELRRKMRQVGVQVQDIGTYLCWHTYVDDPGRQLGLAQLVHLAKSPEVGNIPPPESIPNPQNTTTEVPVDIPFIQTSEDMGDLDEAYHDGKETDEDFNEGDIETIQSDFNGFIAICPQPDYQYSHIEFEYNGNDVELKEINVKEDPLGKITFGVHVKHVNFRGASSIKTMAKVIWTPTTDNITKVEAENEKKRNEYNAKTQQEFEKAYVEAARERIKLSSKILPRNFEDLREEERIVVYRCLIQDMLMKGLPIKDNRTYHALAELLNSIFDIDKMLYFVAPEWWRPRLHPSHQNLGDVRKPVELATGAVTGVKNIHDTVITAKNAGIISGIKYKAADQPPPISKKDTVGWGGINGDRQDNYYITEDSDRAKLGSSLGWLLQLDGDNLRNAFLNAPWVKAVMPIRPGKEKQAMNWLKRLQVEGSDGLDAEYVAPADELAKIPHTGPKVTIQDAIDYLCELVSKKHEDSMKTGKYPTDEINDDNKVSATPIDKVYEHGFYPIQGGFKIQTGDTPFEVFDQWIEILPTDQVVPVEVEYDPKTGRML